MQIYDISFPVSCKKGESVFKKIINNLRILLYNNNKSYENMNRYLTYYYFIYNFIKISTNKYQYIDFLFDFNS